MAQLITPDPIGDTPRQIEDKVRALPENQGKNEGEMWELIDKEVAEARRLGKLRNTEDYHGSETQDVHGKT